MTNYFARFPDLKLSRNKLIDKKEHIQYVLSISKADFLRRSRHTQHNTVCRYGNRYYHRDS
jgi:hypothetical protein